MGGTSLAVKNSCSPLLVPDGTQDNVSFLMDDVLGRALRRRQGRRGDDTK